MSDWPAHVPTAYVQMDGSEFEFTLAMEVERIDFFIDACFLYIKFIPDGSEKNRLQLKKLEGKLQKGGRCIVKVHLGIKTRYFTYIFEDVCFEQQKEEEWKIRLKGEDLRPLFKDLHTEAAMVKDITILC